MPGPSVHLQLTGETVERWRQDDGAPVDLEAPGTIPALLAGAVAPDMGYYPGAQAFVSDLAHYIRTGRLVRSLLAEAFTTVERAFAWGWASHVVADALFHPVINRGAAALRNVDGSLTFAQDPDAHVRIETGLDAFYDARYHTPLVQDVLGLRTGFVARAYERTYGVRISERTFRTAFAAGARFHGPLRTMTRLTHAAFPVRGMPAKVAGAGVAAGSLVLRAVAPGSPIPGLLRGAWPTGALLVGVEAAGEGYHERMDAYQADGFGSLPDYNLDTGTAAEETMTYRLATRTEQQLEKYRGT